MAAQHAIDVDARELHTVEDARAHIVQAALKPSMIGPVGLELEMHLVDLTRPERRVTWHRLSQILADLPPMPARSAITREPGGQVELSTVPASDAAAAIANLKADHQAIAKALAPHKLALVSLGADPARPIERLNPQSRYVGMEQHFVSMGSGDAGRAMMCSTAALQLNVEAGPIAGWSTRVSRMHRLGPVLVAISACSPWLAGRSSGWRSMRQQVWGEMDRARTGPLLDGAHPEDEWASYALAAPVMLVRDSETHESRAVTERVSFAEWLAGDPRTQGIQRRPTTNDLEYHLSTLFPPLRPRGFLELRCLDAVPDRWWPGLAGLAITLIDDDIAAERAAEACAPLDDAWTVAARDGLSDAKIAKAAKECVEAARDRAPAELKAEIEEYADLVASGRTPGDEVQRLALKDGPQAALTQAAQAAIEAVEAYA